MGWQPKGLTVCHGVTSQDHILGLLNSCKNIRMVIQTDNQHCHISEWRRLHCTAMSQKKYSIFQVSWIILSVIYITIFKFFVNINVQYTDTYVHIYNCINLKRYYENTVIALSGLKYV
jgi:hypothetical protein